MQPFLFPVLRFRFWARSPSQRRTPGTMRNRLGPNTLSHRQGQRWAPSTLSISINPHLNVIYVAKLRQNAASFRLQPIYLWPSNEYCYWNWLCFAFFAATVSFASADGGYHYSSISVGKDREITLKLKKSIWQKVKFNKSSFKTLQYNEVE